MITASAQLTKDADRPLLPNGRQLAPTRLTAENQPEVLRFLSERPLHTVVMTSLIGDNGMESALHRGTFYGTRDNGGALNGVALIGHAIFIEARSDEPLRQFALLAQQFPHTHMMMGEHELIERFWKYYLPKGQPARRLCREVLF